MQTTLVDAGVPVFPRARECVVGSVCGRASVSAAVSVRGWMRVSAILRERVHMKACKFFTEGESPWMRHSVTLGKREDACEFGTE